MADREKVHNMREGIKSRLLIDEYDLVEECKKQPALYEEASTDFAQIKAEAKKAKSFLEFTKAKLERSIRHDPERYDLGKITETVVAATVIVQDEYQDAVTKLREAEELSDSIQACVLAVEQRKSMIRDLVTLFDRDYRNSEFSIRGNEEQSGDTRAREIGNMRRSKRNLPNAG